MHAATLGLAMPHGNAAEDMAETVRAFLSRHASVRLREAGRVIAHLAPESSGYSLSTQSGKLICHFWGLETNLVRRIVGVAETRTDGSALHLKSLRLGQRSPAPLHLEAVAPPGCPNQLQREEFRHAIEAAAQREWAGWKFETGPWATAAARSPVQRFLLRRGRLLIPSVAVGADETAVTAPKLLAQALIWAEQVREARPEAVVTALRLISAHEVATELAPLLRWMRHPPAAPVIECFRWDGSAGQLEQASLDADGNEDSGLRRICAKPSPLTTMTTALLAEIHEYCPQATVEQSADGRILFRHYGLEFAREAGPGAEAAFTFGLRGERTPLHAANRVALERLVRRLAMERVPGGDRRSPLFAMQPERWLEHVLRCDPRCLDPEIEPPVHTQVALGRAEDHDFVDLLARDRSGRLLVLELKADEDVAFPLQALRYWTRVREQHASGALEQDGYFPRGALGSEPPRLCLVAPALRWHPRVDAILRWLAPAVPWRRYGLNEEWRHGIQVLYRRDSDPG